jgi:hypothetical protein
MLMKSLIVLASLACLSWLASRSHAAPAGINYDESKVPQYTLPDVLTTLDGRKVTDANMWRQVRRPEVLELFRSQMFGHAPGRPEKMSFDVFDRTDGALDGKAVRKQVKVRFTADANAPAMDILIYLPRGAKAPVPLFVGMNFRRNEAARGTAATGWPVETILARGYGLASIYYFDVEPDRKDGLAESIRAKYLRPGQSAPGPDEWGAIGAWAWGLSRAMDYFETDKDIDSARVAVLGHSRLGKTSLWAGAQDERFALVISNDSGCGGAALSRRHFGETVARINTTFPHWFCGNFHKYNEKEADLPIDQHMLIALMAPRPVYVASAEKDNWADPRGEFLSCVHATPVYKLLGKPGLPTETMPDIDKPVSGTIGYHIRTGAHGITAFDWAQYLDFADKHLRKGE